MSIPGATAIELNCPSCGARLRAPAQAIGHAVQCPSCQRTVAVSAGASPLIAPAPSLGEGSDSPRQSTARARRNEMTVLWLLLMLVGLSIAGYAVITANRTPAPANPNAQAAPAPAVLEPAPNSGQEGPAPFLEPKQTRVRRPPPKKVETPVADETPPATVSKTAEPKVEVVKEAPKEPPMPVDPVMGFESGKAFDNPNDLQRRGRPRPGSFENPTHGPVGKSFENPPPGPSGRRAPNPPPEQRPNRPDPSFDDPK